MIDRIIEFRKEWGLLGTILFAGLIVWTIGWYAVEFVNFLNKVM
tara:strand:+ start:204 stop:335 length:132 start_codon:yes stop_codon:yes gene_type:complete